TVIATGFNEKSVQRSADRPVENDTNVQSRGGGSNFSQTPNYDSRDITEDDQFSQGRGGHDNRGQDEPDVPTFLKGYSSRRDRRRKLSIKYIVRISKGDIFNPISPLLIGGNHLENKYTFRHFNHFVGALNDDIVLGYTKRSNGLSAYPEDSFNMALYIGDD